MKRLLELEALLAAEEASEATVGFADRPRALGIAGSVPAEKLVVDDRRSVGPWLTLASGPCVLDARSGLEHAPSARVSAYAEGDADLSGDRSRPPPQSSMDEVPAAHAAGVWRTDQGTGRTHAAFDDRLRAMLRDGPHPGPGSRAHPPASRVRPMGSAEDPGVVLERMVALETAVYEPARRDPPEKLRRAFDDPHGVVVLAEVEGAQGWQLAGFSLGVPLETVGSVDGVRRDAHFGANDTLYALTTTVDPAARGLQIGLRLKAESIRAAAALRTADGHPRYRWISGRNRVGATAAMMRINRKLGAHVLFELEGQYGGDGVAAYYRMPVGSPVPPSSRREHPGGIHLDDPRILLRHPPSTHRVLERAGGLYGPWVSVVEPTADWTTPAVERTRRLFAALTPELPHVAFARQSRHLRAQAEPFAGTLRAPAEAGGGFSDETRTCGWRGDPGHFFAARKPLAVLWAPRPGLVALHSKEPVRDAGGDALAIVRARHDVVATAHLDRRPEPLGPLLSELGFRGGEGTRNRRLFTRPCGERGARVAAEALAERGVVVGTEGETLQVALPWDLTGEERAHIEEVLGSELR